MQIGNAGVSFDSVYSPTLPGTPGTYYPGYGYSGFGGGVLVVNVTYLTVNSVLAADGSAPVGGAGGGGGADSGVGTTGVWGQMEGLGDRMRC